MSRVTLRAMEPEDLDLLYRIENDNSLWNVGITNVPYSRYILRDFIASSTGDIYKDGQVRLIIENSEREVVGIADLVNFDARNCRAEVGIVIECQHQRKGYAAEALSLMADYSRKVLHLHQLYAIVSKDNFASIALFSKAGYQVTAEMKDWLYTGKEYISAQLLQMTL